MPGNLRSDASHSLVVSKSICIRITKINLTPVSRFTPSFNASFPTLAKHKEKPIPRTGYRQQPSFVSRSLARSLPRSQKDATQYPNNADAKMQ
jgi:hypothetical protein